MAYWALFILGVCVISSFAVILVFLQESDYKVVAFGIICSIFCMYLFSGVLFYINNPAIILTYEAYNNHDDGVGQIVKTTKLCKKYRFIGNECKDIKVINITYTKLMGEPVVTEIK